MKLTLRWMCACAWLVGLALRAQTPVTDLTLSNLTLSSGTTTYQASNTITAGNAVTVNGSANVTFKAGNFVKLSPGFQATAGSGSPTFRAQVGTPVCDAPPVNVSVSPASNSTPGTSATFAFTASSNSGACIQWMEMNFNYDNVAGGGCFLAYWPGSNVVSLAGDNGDTWPFSGTLGSAGTLQNSQCQVNLAGSSVAVTSTAVTVNLALTFLPGLPGLQKVFLQTGDSNGLMASWQQMGTWLTSTLIPGPPTGVSVSPTSGSGMQQTFTYVGASANGYAYVTSMVALVGTSTTYPAVNSCYVYYERASKLLFLLGNSGAWDATVQQRTLGVAGTMSNSQCTVDAGASSVSGSGNNLTLNLALSFASGWTGTKNNYLWVYDRQYQYSGWWTTTPAATWTVGTAPPPPPADFTLTLTPAARSVTAGEATSYTVTVAPASGSFTGTVSITPSGLPAGASCNCPLSVTLSGSGAAQTPLQISTTTSTPAGTFTLAVTGATNGLAHSQPATLAVQAAPDFVLTVDKTFQEVAPGTPATYYVTVVPRNGFNQAVWLQQVAGSAACGPILASGMQVSAFDALQPNVTIPITLTYWGINLRCITFAAASGGSGPGHSVTLHLSTEQVATFSVRGSTAPQTVTPPGTASYTISVASAFNYSGTVALYAAGLPAGATWSFSPSSNVVVASGGTSSAALNVTVPAGAIPGTYPVTVTGISGTMNPYAVVWLTVQSGADFSVTASPSAQSASPTGVAGYSIFVSSYGNFSGTVNLSATGLPTSTTASINPQTVNGSGYATLTITTTGAKQGSFPITVSAQSGASRRSTTALLNVSATSPANILTPGNGSILTSSPTTFTWASDSGASQYHLSLGSVPDGSDYYSVYTGSNATALCPDGKFQCQSAAINIPNNGQQNVYATLSSLISGSWQSVRYNYRLGSLPASGGSTKVAAGAQSGSYSINNNNQQTFTGPYQATCWYGYPYYDWLPCDAGYYTDCKVSPSGGVTVGPISVPSQSYPDDYSTMDVALTADDSATPGSRILTCSMPGLISLGSAEITVYDANPHIDYVDQLPPEYPGGPFFIVVYGTNFGPSPGSLSVCNTTATNCSDGTPDIAVSLNGPCPNPQLASWTKRQICAVLTPSPSAVGDYLVQVASSGATGSGFQPAPQGRTNAKSNFGSVTVSVNPVTLTVNRQSLMEVLATGTPAGGSYATGIVGLLAAHQNGVGNPVQLSPNSTVGPQSATIKFIDPPNPNPGPSQGGIGQVSTIYVAPSGISALKQYQIPTNGVYT